MLPIKMLQEIQELKLRGYSINEIVEYYQNTCKKPPTLPTIRKYYKMDTLPENPGKNLEKDKVFDNEPLRSATIEILRNNTGMWCAPNHRSKFNVSKF